MSHCGQTIFNRYNGKTYFVPCGKCKACRMDKANKIKRRIKNACDNSGLITLFVTLTYNNDSVPFVVRDEVDFDNCVNIYRGVFSPDIVARCLYCSGDFSSCKPLRGQSDLNKIGVLLYSDLQNFFKRFRINYERTFKSRLEFKYFAVAEYGSQYARPHFHTLITFPAYLIDSVKATIVKSWPFCSPYVLVRGIEIAKDASRYVSGYLLKSHSVPSLLQTKAFSEKRSHSSFYGITENRFGIKKMFEALRSRTPEYNVTITRDGKSSTVSLPVPQYVRYFWFSKCKGDCFLSPYQKRALLAHPEIYLYIESCLTTSDLIDVYNTRFSSSIFFENLRDFLNQYNSISQALDFAGYNSIDPFSSGSDFYVSYRNIHLRQIRFFSSCPSYSLVDFVAFQMSWSAMWSSYIIQLNHSKKLNIPLDERYDNLYQVIHDCFELSKLGQVSSKKIPLFTNMIAPNEHDLLTNPKFLSHVKPPSQMVHSFSEYLSKTEQFDTIEAQHDFNEFLVTMGNELFNPNYK